MNREKAEAENISSETTLTAIATGFTLQDFKKIQSQTTEMAEHRNKLRTDEKFELDDFVNKKGDIVTLGRFNPDSRPYIGYYDEDRDSDHVWFIQTPDIAREVTIPGKFSGDSLMFRNGTGTQSIYDIRDAKDQELTDDLKFLKASFGDSLVKAYGPEYAQLLSWESPDTSDPFINLDDILEERRKIDHHEALDIEHAALKSKHNIRKHIFESSKHLLQREEKAYRDTLDDQLKQ